MYESLSIHLTIQEFIVIYNDLKHYLQTQMNKMLKHSQRKMNSSYMNSKIVTFFKKTPSMRNLLSSSSYSSSFGSMLTVDEMSHDEVGCKLGVGQWQYSFILCQGSLCSRRRNQGTSCGCVCPVVDVYIAQDVFKLVQHPDVPFVEQNSKSRWRPSGRICLSQ